MRTVRAAGERSVMRARVTARRTSGSALPSSVFSDGTACVIPVRPAMAATPMRITGSSSLNSAITSLGCDWASPSMAE